MSESKLDNAAIERARAAVADRIAVIASDSSIGISGVSDLAYALYLLDREQDAGVTPKGAPES